MAMKKDELTELTKDGFEFVIDQIIDNELVQDIPVVNSAVNLLKLGARTIPDYFFAKKLDKFLKGLDSVSAKEKEKIKSFAQKDKNAERLCEHLLNSINKASDERKADFIACLFLGYVDGAIDVINFQRALDVVDNVFIDDLIRFVKEAVSKDGYFPDDHQFYNHMPSVFNGSLVMDNREVRSSAHMQKVFETAEIGSPVPVKDVFKKMLSPLGRALVDGYMRGQSIRSK